MQKSGPSTTHGLQGKICARDRNGIPRLLGRGYNGERAKAPKNLNLTNGSETIEFAVNKESSHSLHNSFFDAFIIQATPIVLQYVQFAA
ncbi:MAG: hypothetical protein AAFO69_20715 [Bacteroidota bacterium]